MASNGELGVEELEGLYQQGLLRHNHAILRLFQIVREQREQIRQLEQEVFKRCGDLRQRVATMEQSNGGRR